MRRSRVGALIAAGALAAPSPVFSAPKSYPGSLYPASGAARAAANETAPVIAAPGEVPESGTFDALIASAVGRHPLLAADQPEAALAANRQARDLVAERFRASRGTLIDLIEAENDWFEAGVRQLSGRADARHGGDGRYPQRQAHRARLSVETDR